MDVAKKLDLSDPAIELSNVKEAAIDTERGVDDKSPEEKPSFWSTFAWLLLLLAIC